MTTTVRQSSQAVYWNTATIFQTLENHSQTLKSLGVRKLGLFGSYKRGTTRPNSDMDFLVVLEHLTFDAYMDTKFFLEDLFQCDVDLVLESDIKSRLRPYILDEVVYVSGL